MDTGRFRLKATTHCELAIFITRTGAGTHTGILFQDRDILKILDLQWHNRLRAATCSMGGGSPPHVVPKLEPEEVHDVRGMCRLVCERHQDGQRIPYAFGMRSWFNHAGNIVLGDGYGLTCSTFVVKIFAAVGVNLVSHDEWPKRPEDVERQSELIELMKKGAPGVPPVPTDHISRVESELPCFRIRPEEISGAALFDVYPVNFPDSELAGKWLIRQIGLDE